MSEKKISLHLNSNKPKSFQGLIGSLLHTTHDINNIEVIVNIDKNDEAMKNIIQDLNNKSPGLINFFETDTIKDFSDAWKTLSLLLENTSEKVTLLACISDDLRFITKNWDKILLSYENYFDDGIYRLRCSKFKNQTYNDLWQCGYAPDAYSFYSITWMKTVGQWCPCIGPDSFQECISFYMKKISSKYDRNIIVEDISFSGESVSSGINLITRIKRTRIYYKAFFILMSYKNQVIALNSAKKIIKNLKNFNDEINLDSYNINFFEHKLKNTIRRFNFFKHRGSSNHPIDSFWKNIFFMIWCKMSYLDYLLLRIIKYLYKSGHLRRFIKNDNQYKNLAEIIENE